MAIINRLLYPIIKGGIYFGYFVINLPSEIPIYTLKKNFRA